MKVAVIGGSGFIGRHFLNEFESQFNEVRCLVREPSDLLSNRILQIKGLLNDKIAIEHLTKDINVVVHAGFDSQYQENISGIHNVLEAISINKVAKLIYLSSYVVYDSTFNPILAESSSYSTINDIYTVEKQNIEAILEKYASNHPEVSILTLQPTIVYGLGGNWTTTFIKANKHKTIKIPNRGNNICPLIYVKDVTKAICECVFAEYYTTKNNYEKILLSSSEDISWRNVYEFHGSFLKKLGKKIYANSYEESYSGNFGNSFLKNKAIQILFTKSMGVIFISFLKAVKRRVHKKESLNEVMDLPGSVVTFKMVGLYKFLHKSNATIDITKAKKIFNFKPRFTLEDGINDMVKDYVKQNWNELK